MWFAITDDMQPGGSKKVKSIVAKSHKIFALTHTYTGYPMGETGTLSGAAGCVGKINKSLWNIPRVVVRLSGEWGYCRYDVADRPAKSRTFPCVMGDIGIHAENLGRYITGWKVEKNLRGYSHFIPGNQLDAMPISGAYTAASRE